KLDSTQDAVLRKTPTTPSGPGCQPSAEHAHIQVFLPYPNWPVAEDRILRLRRVAVTEGGPIFNGVITTNVVHQIYGFSYDCTDKKPALCVDYHRDFKCDGDKFWEPKQIQRGAVVNLHIWAATAFVPSSDHISHALCGIKTVFNGPDLAVNPNVKLR